MSPPRALPDTARRRRAASVFDRNLVVTAGAGTGKTALLVERALNLVAGTGLPIESIAAITFTEKAAAELRVRLAKGLDELRRLAQGRAQPGDLDLRTEAERAFAWLRSEAGIEPPAIEARALEALTKLDAAAVSTIHAFCSEILRRYPKEARVDPDFRVDEGLATDRLFEEEWEGFLEAELGKRPPRADVWRRALARPGALGAVRELGRSLCSFGLPDEAVSPETLERQAPVEALLGGTIRGSLEEIARILQHASNMNKNMRTFLETASTLLGSCLRGGPDAMARVASPMPLGEFLESGLPSPGKGLAGTLPRDVEAAASRAQDLVRILAAVDEEAATALLRAAVPFASRFRERALEAGIVTFDGLLRLTRDLLAREPGV
ncbi:MAG TPA: UvrD-helicase domain-containing protein, partial [Candidatus Polarisedimenticolia bacterium]|nr:UvrD-helicase domain-containing protein [Candidatus Polarisedimenticolia bacterium]